MYAGHFAAALALKAAKPETPTWALILAGGALDVAFGALVILGVEGAMPDYKVSHRLLLPWSHSLLSALAIGLVFAGMFYKRGLSVMAVLFAGVLSHWALDVLVHRPDVPLWPWGGPLLGFADVFGSVSGWFETVAVVLFLAFYIYGAGTRSTFGGRRLAACLCIGVFWIMGLAT